MQVDRYRFENSRFNQFSFSYFHLFIFVIINQVSKLNILSYHYYKQQFIFYIHSIIGEYDFNHF